MKIRTKFTRTVASILCVASLGIAGVADAQLLGGAGTVGGGFGGTLSGAPRSFGGAAQGGLNGSSQFNSNAVSARRVGDRLEAHAKSNADHAADKASSDIATAKTISTRGASRTESGVARMANTTSNAASASAGATSAAATNLQSNSATDASSGTAWGATSVNRAGAATTNSTALAGAAKSAAATQPQAMHSPPPVANRKLAPAIDASGDASANASANRSKNGMPKTETSASADGNVSASHR